MTTKPADVPAEKKSTSPPLPPKVEEAIAMWESALIETLGSKLDTAAWNSFTPLRANLRAVIAAALA